MQLKTLVSRFKKTPDAWAILFVNVLFMAVALWQQLDLMMIVIAYLFETAIMCFFVLVEIWVEPPTAPFLQSFRIGGVDMAKESTLVKKIGASMLTVIIFALLLFIFYFFFFFYSSITSTSFPSIDFSNLVVPLVIFFLSQLFLFAFSLFTSFGSSMYSERHGFHRVYVLFYIAFAVIINNFLIGLLSFLTIQFSAFLILFLFMVFKTVAEVYVCLKPPANY